MNKHIITWRPRGDLSGADDNRPFWFLHRQVNELFNDFFRDFGRPYWLALPNAELSKQRAEVLLPCIDVAQTDQAIQVTAELPGLDEKDIEVTLENQALVIKGNKKQESEETKKNYQLTERSYGEFLRVIPLPEEIKKEEVKAQFKKGVLSITIPKAEQAKEERKRIAIVKE